MRQITIGEGYLRIKTDRITQRILTALQEDGRLPVVTVAERVGLSDAACLRRIRKLEREGVIQSYATVVDRHALGLSVVAFVLVTLEKQPSANTDDFHERVCEEPHVVECHAMSGAHDYLMKVVARDMDHFSELVMRRILRFPGVRHVESSFSLSEIKHSQTLPVAAGWRGE